MQVFYEEFGELMMEQPVIGLDFQTWLPVAIVPYILLLSFNLFNRWAELPDASMGVVQMRRTRRQARQPVPAQWTTV